MGRATDSKIRAWQERAGITPARGRRVEILNGMLWEAVRIARQPPLPRPSDPAEPAVERVAVMPYGIDPRERREP